MTKTLDYIDKDICNQIISVVLKEMKNVLKDYNIDIKRKAATYSNNNIQVKFEFSLINSAGKVLDRKVTDFPLYAHRYGLTSKDLGRKFSYKNENYKITGINRSAPKYPVCTVLVGTDESFKFAARTVENALHGKKEYNIKQVI